LKKYKYLVINGCSYSEGCGLDNPSVHKVRFGRLLSKKMNVSEINLSRQGGSNDRIFRTLFDWIQDNKEKCKDSLVIIGLTEMYREELYSVHTKKYCRFQYPNIDSRCDIKRFKENSGIEEYEGVADYLKYRLMNFVNADFFVEKVNRDIVLLDSFAKQNKLDIVFFDTIRDERELDVQGNFIDDWTEEEIKSRLDFVKDNNLNWFMFPNNEKNWKNYMRHLDKTYDGNHPNKKQHQELSEIIWEYLNEKFK
jgi:hypothetical protein